MHVLDELWQSTVGKKALVAVSGLVLWIWVVLHVLGNLTMFSGATAIDGYAAALQRVPAGLWAARAGLATAAVVHVAGVVSLARTSWAARPRHAAPAPRTPSALAARTMRVGGVLLLAFVGYHVLHLTVGVLHPGFTPGRVYDNVMVGLRPGWVAAVYVAAAALLGLHLFRRGGGPSLGLAPEAAAACAAPPWPCSPPRWPSASRAVAHRGARGVAAMIRPGAGSAMVPSAPLERPATDGIPERCDTAPSGPIATRWERRRAELDLVGPIRRRRHQVVVVGAGLAGASAAATLSELGYRVRCLCFHDSPRRAHSVAAQGGINAAKNYQNDGDSVERLVYDTLKGGDFRSRESNVYRLAELSARIIDHAVAQGVPFAREYGGQLANRSFGGALVSRTFYARGQTGQQLLLGAYQALAKEEAAGSVTMLPRREMLDLVV